MVQTGFPTSLIDLFVKNRDRLKKISKMKSTNQKKPSSPPSSPSQSLPSPTPPPPCNSDHEGVAIGDFGCVADGAVDGDRSGGGNGGSFLWVLKVCVVVVGLGFREIAMRIMIAAFFLLFVEYVGTRFLCFSKSWLKSWLIFLGSWIQSKMELGAQEGSYGELIGLKSNCIEEIQIVEENFEKKSGSFEKGSKNRSLYLEEEKAERIEVLIRNERSSKFKIRARFIKKIALKKFKTGKKRESSKKVESKEPEECKIVGEDGEEKLRIFEVTNNTERQEESCSTCSGGNAGGSLILVSIVLAGLVGGKAIAFLLTVSWCFMIRIVGKERQIRCIVLP